MTVCSGTQMVAPLDYLGLTQLTGGWGYLGGRRPPR